MFCLLYHFIYKTYAQVYNIMKNFIILVLISVYKIHLFCDNCRPKSFLNAQGVTKVRNKLQFPSVTVQIVHRRSALPDKFSFSCAH